MWTADPMMKWHGAPLTAVTGLTVSQDTDGRNRTLKTSVTFTRGGDERGNRVSSVVTQYVVFGGTGAASRQREVGRYRLKVSDTGQCSHVYC